MTEIASRPEHAPEVINARRVMERVLKSGVQGTGFKTEATRKRQILTVKETYVETGQLRREMPLYVGKPTPWDSRIWLMGDEGEPYHQSEGGIKRLLDARHIDAPKAVIPLLSALAQEGYTINQSVLQDADNRIFDIAGTPEGQNGKPHGMIELVAGAEGHKRIFNIQTSEAFNLRDQADMQRRLAEVRTLLNNERVQKLFDSGMQDQLVYLSLDKIERDGQTLVALSLDRERYKLADQRQAFLFNNEVVLGPQHAQVKVTTHGEHEIPEEREQELIAAVQEQMWIQPEEAFTVLTSDAMKEIRNRAQAGVQVKRNGETQTVPIRIEDMQLHSVGRYEGNVETGIMSLTLVAPSQRDSTKLRRLPQIVDVRMHDDHRLVETRQTGEEGQRKTAIRVEEVDGDIRIPKTSPDGKPSQVLYPSWGGTTQTIEVSRVDVPANTQSGKFVPVEEVVARSGDMATVAEALGEASVDERYTLRRALMQRQEVELLRALQAGRQSQSLNWVVLAGKEDLPAQTHMFSPLVNDLAADHARDPEVVGAALQWHFGRNKTEGAVTVETPLFTLYNHAIRYDEQTGTYSLKEVRPRFERKNAVVVGLMVTYENEKNELVHERIYVNELRGPLGGFGMQPAAGMVDEGELNPGNTALRELFEELDIRLTRNELMRLGILTSAPDVGPEQLTFYGASLRLTKDQAERLHQTIGGAADENEQTEVRGVKGLEIPSGPRDLKGTLLDRLFALGVTQGLISPDTAVYSMETFLAANKIPAPELVATMVVNRAYGLDSGISIQQIKDITGVEITPEKFREWVDRVPRTLIGTMSHALWQRDFAYTHPGDKDRWKPLSAKDDAGWEEAAIRYEGKKGKFPSDAIRRNPETGALEVDILHMNFEELPPSWQENSIGSASEALRLLRERVQEGGLEGLDIMRTVLHSAIYPEDGKEGYVESLMSDRNTAVVEQIHQLGSDIHEYWLKNQKEKGQDGDYLTRHTYPVMRLIADGRFDEVEPHILEEVFQGAITDSSIREVLAEQKGVGIEELHSEDLVITEQIRRVISKQAQAYILETLKQLYIPTELIQKSRGNVLEDLKYVLGAIDVLNDIADRGTVVPLAA